MMRLVTILLFIAMSAMGINAQELNATLTINTQKIQSVNNDVLTSLKDGINQMLNDQQWTDTRFARSERINCIVAITVNEMPSESEFVTEIQITVRRPVYNSSYVTPILNYKDAQFNFSYILNEPLSFNSQNVTNNLVAVIAFYAYITIGFDFDSFSLNGGRPYFTKAMEIANSAQSLNTKGWEPFSGGRGNRYDLALALTDESSKDFHSMWYKYHRLGLDEMAANPSRGRLNVMESMQDLKKLYDARPSSILLTIFAETKLDELIRICSKATNEEKQEMRKMLLQMFPAKSNTINMLK